MRGFLYINKNTGKKNYIPKTQTHCLGPFWLLPTTVTLLVPSSVSFALVSVIADYPYWPFVIPGAVVILVSVP